MKKFEFNGHLLAASKNLANGAWHTIAIYSGENNKVNVVVFDCDDAKKIPSEINKLIADIEFNPNPSKQDLKNLVLLRKLRKQLADNEQQEVPNKLIYSVKRNFPVLGKDNCIYLPEKK